MTRPSRFAARTLRRLRPSTSRGRGKLRLDTLEAREQPGSVWSGLTAGGMLEPLQVMAAVVGPDALTLDPSP